MSYEQHWKVTVGDLPLGAHNRIDRDWLLPPLPCTGDETMPATVTKPRTKLRTKPRTTLETRRAFQVYYYRRRDQDARNPATLIVWASDKPDAECRFMVAYPGCQIVKTVTCRK